MFCPGLGYVDTAQTFSCPTTIDLVILGSFLTAFAHWQNKCSFDRAIGKSARVSLFFFSQLGLVTQHTWHQILNQLNLSAQKWCSGILGLITGKQRGTDHSSSQTWLILQQGIRLKQRLSWIGYSNIHIEIKVLFTSNSIRMATPGYIERQLSVCLSCWSVSERPLLLTPFFTQ